MAGIPNDVYNLLRATLLECGPFDSDRQLQAIFANDLLAPWRNRLPQANTIADRVETLISFLMDKRRSEAQMNALVLFLKVLKDRTDPSDDCYERLQHLIDDLGTLLSDNPKSMKTIVKTSNSIAVSKSGPTGVFISCSRKDKKYLEELHVHLAHYIRTERLDVWDDTKILPGTKWREEIEKALQSAKIAVLLISPNFLASEFIATYELPSLLVAAEQEGVIILPVILRACVFEDTDLAQFQAVNAPSRPLATMMPGKRDEIWSKVARIVSNALS